MNLLNELMDTLFCFQGGIKVIMYLVRAYPRKKSELYFRTILPGVEVQKQRKKSFVNSMERNTMKYR
jgi:hypothetical protein